MKQIIKIGGMYCSMCEIRVCRILEGIGDVETASADYSKGEAVITSERIISETELEAAFKNTGYAYIKSESQWLKRVPYAIPALIVGIWLLLKKLNLLYIFDFFPQADENSGYAALFVIGVLTSFHCIAMCGGINLSQSAGAAKKNQSVLKSNMAYQMGRLISYSLLGGVIGAVGKAVSLNQQVKGLITIAAGMWMLAMAFHILGVLQPGKKLRFSYRWIEKIGTHIAGKGAFVIGFLNGFMPCGPLQSMQIYALSTGSFLKGMLSMFLFCLGTIPLLFLFGYVGGRLNSRFSGIMFKCSGIIVLLMSVSMLQNGLALTGISNLTDLTRQAVEDENIAVVDGGRQTVQCIVDYNSYESVTVQKGLPVEMHIYVPEGKLIGCNNEILIPEYQIDQKLQEGDNIITFTPDESGTFAFTCWMGMIKSSITVVDKIE